MIKIVLVSFLYEPNLGGGAAQVVFTMAHNLLNEGYKVTIITSSSNKATTINYDEGIKVIRFPLVNLYWVYEKDRQSIGKRILWQLIDIWNPFVYKLVRHFLYLENPDVVHVHKLRGLSPAVWTAARANCVPVIAHTCHDYELISPQGLLMGKIGEAANRRSLILRTYQELRAHYSRVINRASAPSHFVLDKHQRMGFFNNAYCKVIPNTHGYNKYYLEQLSNLPVDKTDHPLRLLYIGRLAMEKGIDDLCQAFSQTLQRHPHISLSVVGWGPLEEELRNRYIHIPNILFHGALFGEDKNQLIKNCDLLVMPTKVFETFGIVITEALAYGKPVLATRIGGIPEIIKEGENGFLFSPDNRQELIHIIDKLAENPSQLGRLRESCIQSAKKFASDIVMQEYRELYNGKPL